MTTVEVDLRRPAQDGTDVPARGTLECVPTARRDVDDYIVLPEAFTARLVDGLATLDLAPTVSGTWAWKITERTNRGAKRLVSVPDSVSAVNYADLPDVDPNTLDPTTPGIPAWQAYIDAQILDLIANAPGALDTLNELAAALGDDPNFATTVTNLINLKADQTDLDTLAADTAAALSAGLATKVNSSTYTAGLALKADVTALTAEASARAAADALKADATALTSEIANRTAADALLAPKADPTFTGTVSGVTKSHVGLGNVDNTSDANKPISTAQAAVNAVKVDATAAGKATLAVVENSKLWPFRAALGRRDNDLVNIGVLGASASEGAFVGAFDRTISSRLATLLRNRYPTKGLTGGGRGFIGVPSKELTTSAQYTAGMWPQAYTGGLFDPASAGAASAFDLGGKHMAWYTNVTATKVVHTLASAITSFEIHQAVGASGGTTTGYYKIDGGSAVAFRTDLLGSNILTVNAPATTSIEVGWNGAGYLIFTGIREYASDEAKGIQVHNLGHSGMKIADWQDGYAVTNSWRTAIAALNLDLLILHDLGANDAFAGLTPAQVKTALLAFVAVLRSGGITCPIVLSAMFDPSGGATVTPSWAAYATIMREIADADSTIVFVDHSVRMPSTAVTDTLALYSTVDHVHARADGAVNQWIASTYDAILAAA